MTISINISTTNLLDPRVPKAGSEKRSSSIGLDPDALVLEITETTAMEQIDQCKRAIQELRDLGVGVSVDDFGAGFTSLAYLGSLAVNELKLDRSFINGLAVREGSRDLTLIRSTINLAHALGLRVVAEGVEEQASLDLLSSFGCDIAQGYLISRPKPATELTFHPEAAVSTSSEEPAVREAPVDQETSMSRERARDRPLDTAPGPDERVGPWRYDPLPSAGNL